ncbi:DNA replication protein psf2 [Gryganskiella cystojenkinii]|nr:DNA replication protein psf2 [Gryganskiella cystojenkinii]
MALPRHLKNGLTPLEIEFLAENEPIEIAAAIDTRQDLELIGGTLPPLKPLQLSQVPLWLAISLKKKHKCSIVPPLWMSVESLQKSLKDEQENGLFSGLPYHFMETAQILLENACDDIPCADTVRMLLKDLREARQSKARQGVASLGSVYVQMDNIGLMEINEIRPFFTKAFYELAKLKPTGQALDQEYGHQGSSQDYGSSTGRFDGTVSHGSSVLHETSRFNRSTTHGSRNESR